MLCGDLTNFGKTTEAEILAEDIKSCSIPVIGVLGNHDYECGQPEKVVEILTGAGMKVLDEQAIEIDGVGFAGVKGFMGGYGRGELAPFGEPIAKLFVDEAMNEARKLENQLRTLRTDRSVAVLHYSPIEDTIEGEPGDLPISRLAAAMRPDRPLRSCEGGHPRPRPSWHLRRQDAARNAGLQCRPVRGQAEVRPALRAH